MSIYAPARRPAVYRPVWLEAAWTAWRLADAAFFTVVLLATVALLVVMAVDIVSTDIVIRQLGGVEVGNAAADLNWTPLVFERFGGLVGLWVYQTIKAFVLVVWLTLASPLMSCLARRWRMSLEERLAVMISRLVVAATLLLFVLVQLAERVLLLPPQVVEATQFVFSSWH